MSNNGSPSTNAQITATSSQRAPSQDTPPSSKSPKQGKKRKETPVSDISPSQKKPKKLSDAESEIVVNAYTHYDGNWDKIMKDSRIIALARKQSHLKNHITHKKREKNKVLNSNRGKEQRASIVQTIHESGEESDEEELVETFVGDENSDGDDNGESAQTPPLPNTLQQLHHSDKGLFDDAISSNSITSSSDFTQQATKITDAQKVRTTRIRQRSKDGAANSNFIRDQQIAQQQAQQSNNEFKQMMMMMTQNQKQMEQEREDRKQQLQQQQMEREDRRRQINQQQLVNNVILMKLLGISSNDMNNIFNPQPPQNNDNSNNEL